MLNEEAFARIVAEDVKNRVTDEQARYLRLPENRDQWRRNIIALLQNLSDQLEEIDLKERRDRERYGALGDDGVRLLAEAQADTDQRRKRISRFRFHVEKRLDEINRLDSLGSDDAHQRGAAVDFLRRAIEKHKELTHEAELDPTPIDHALWETLQGQWRFDTVNIDDIH